MDDSRDGIDGADGRTEAGADGSESPASESDLADSRSELPADVVDEAERLTRLARAVDDERARNAYRERRADLLREYGFVARVRDADDTLVCHPGAWLEDGTVRTDRIEDRSRAVEVSLSGPGDPDDWAALDARNRELVAAVREAHGEAHGANAAAFADFMGNHRARPVTDATAADVEEFLGEYYVRNAWPSERQRDVVERSLALLFETADEPVPAASTVGRLERG